MTKYLLIGTWVVLISITLTCKHASNSKTQESYGVTGSDGQRHNNLYNIPIDGLPFGWVERNVGAFLKSPTDAAPLAERKAWFDEPFRVDEQQLPWVSSFWPEFLNGVGNRWQTNFLQQLLGYKVKDEVELLNNLLRETDDDGKGASSWVSQLSPIEKYDLAVGRYVFTATMVELSLRGRYKNDPIAFWEGFCNGVAAASINEAVPQHPVSVRNPDGITVTFYPNDIKALLALSYYMLDETRYLGERCDNEELTVDDTGRLVDVECRDLNPGALVIALFNRIGIAGKPMVMEVDKAEAVWNFPIIGAGIFIEAVNKHVTIDSDNQERLIKLFGTSFPAKFWQNLIDLQQAGVPVFSYPHVDPKTRYILPVRIEVDVWSETSVVETTRSSKTRKFHALLELDPQLNIIGGEWETKGAIKGENSPDFIWFPGAPQVDIDNRLTVNQQVDQRVIKWIAALSQKKQMPPAGIPPKFIEKRSRHSFSQGFLFNWAYDHNQLRFAGKITQDVKSDSPDAIYYGELVAEDLTKVATFAIRDRLFTHRQNWYFSTPPAYGQLIFRNRDHEVIASSGKIALHNPDLADHIQIRPPLHQSTHWKDNKLHVSSVVLMEALLKPFSPDLASIGVLSEGAELGRKDALEFHEKLFEVQHHYRNLHTAQISFSTSSTPHAMYFSVFDEYDQEQIDFKMGIAQSLGLIPLIKTVKVEDPEVFPTGSGSFDQSHWQNPAFRQNFPGRVPLFPALSFTNFQPENIYLYKGQRVQLAASAYRHIVQHQLESVFLSALTIQLKQRYEGQTLGNGLTLKRYGQVLGTYQIDTLDHPPRILIRRK